MKKLKITLGGKVFYAELLTDKAPKTIQMLEECAPFTSMVIAAKICDHEIQWPTPFYYEELENPVFDQDPGSIIYFPPRQCICCFYGETLPVEYCNKFAQILPEDLPGFFEEAQKVWSNQGVHVITEIVEE